jgi:hypothetical protein
MLVYAYKSLIQLSKITFDNNSETPPLLLPSSRKDGLYKGCVALLHHGANS